MFIKFETIRGISMNFQEFKEKVSREIGIRLASYKEKRVKRRTNNFMKKHGISDYVAGLQKIKKEQSFRQEFLEHMTINTSEFFRNPANFDYLKEKILPKLFKNNRKVKIWSAASSNGCEAYTIAIILKEMGISPDKFNLKATDIDPSILKEARRAKYKNNSFKKMDKSLLSKYFTKSGDYYQLKKEIMQTVNFGRLDLLKDSYENNINLILCRNVFIYFTKEVKDDLTMKLSNALAKDGILFLGNTEYLLNPEKFNLEKVHTSFYRKIN